MKRLLAISSALILTLTVQVSSALAQNQIQSQTRIEDLQDVPDRIMTVLMIFLPAIATFYLILTGYRYIVAQGNPELTEKTKKSLTYAVYGVIVAYSSVLLITLFSDALNFNPGF